MGTKLDFPLLANQKYKFSIAACRSAVYTSLGPTAPSYHKAVRLRIWGGNNFCGREELLAQSETVSNTDWKVLKFTILPEMDYEFIQLEAFYVENTTIQYNGNILIDKASAFEPI